MKNESDPLKMKEYFLIKGRRKELPDPYKGRVWDSVSAVKIVYTREFAATAKEILASCLFLYSKRYNRPLRRLDTITLDEFVATTLRVSQDRTGHESSELLERVKLREDHWLVDIAVVILPSMTLLSFLVFLKKRGNRGVRFSNCSSRLARFRSPYCILQRVDVQAKGYIIACNA